MADKPVDQVSEYYLTKILKVAEGVWQRRGPSADVSPKLYKALSLVHAGRQARAAGKTDMAQRIDKSANLALMNAAILELRNSAHGRELLAQLNLLANDGAARHTATDDQA